MGFSTMIIVQILFFILSIYVIPGNLECRCTARSLLGRLCLKRVCDLPKRDPCCSGLKKLFCPIYRDKYCAPTSTEVIIEVDDSGGNSQQSSEISLDQHQSHTRVQKGGCQKQERKFSIEVNILQKTSKRGCPNSGLHWSQKNGSDKFEQGFVMKSGVGHDAVHINQMENSGEFGGIQENAYRKIQKGVQVNYHQNTKGHQTVESKHNHKSSYFIHKGSPSKLQLAPIEAESYSDSQMDQYGYTRDSQKLLEAQNKESDSEFLMKQHYDTQDLVQKSQMNPHKHTDETKNIESNIVEEPFSAAHMTKEDIFHILESARAEESGNSHSRSEINQQQNIDNSRKYLEEQNQISQSQFNNNQFDDSHQSEKIESKDPTESKSGLHMIQEEISHMLETARGNQNQNPFNSPGVNQPQNLENSRKYLEEHNQKSQSQFINNQFENTHQHEKIEPKGNGELNSAVHTTQDESSHILDLELAGGSQNPFSGPGMNQPQNIENSKKYLEEQNQKSKGQSINNQYGNSHQHERIESKGTEESNSAVHTTQDESSHISDLELAGGSQNPFSGPGMNHPQNIENSKKYLEEQNQKSKGQSINNQYGNSHQHEEIESKGTEELNSAVHTAQDESSHILDLELEKGSQNPFSGPGLNQPQNLGNSRKYLEERNQKSKGQSINNQNENSNQHEAIESKGTKELNNAVHAAQDESSHISDLELAEGSQNPISGPGMNQPQYLENSRKYLEEQNQKSKGQSINNQNENSNQHETVESKGTKELNNAVHTTQDESSHILDLELAEGSQNPFSGPGMNQPQNLDYSRKYLEEQNQKSKGQSTNNQYENSHQHEKMEPKGTEELNSAVNTAQHESSNILDVGLADESQKSSEVNRQKNNENLKNHLEEINPKSGLIETDSVKKSNSETHITQEEKPHIFESELEGASHKSDNSTDVNQQTNDENSGKIQNVNTQRSGIIEWKGKKTNSEFHRTKEEISHKLESTHVKKSQEMFRKTEKNQNDQIQHEKIEQESAKEVSSIVTKKDLSTKSHESFKVSELNQHEKTGIADPSGIDKLQKDPNTKGSSDKLESSFTGKSDELFGETPKQNQKKLEEDHNEEKSHVILQEDRDGKTQHVKQQEDEFMNFQNTSPGTSVQLEERQDSEKHHPNDGSKGLLSSHEESSPNLPQPISYGNQIEEVQNLKEIPKEQDSGSNPKLRKNEQRTENTETMESQEPYSDTHKLNEKRSNKLEPNHSRRCQEVPGSGLEVNQHGNIDNSASIESIEVLDPHAPCKNKADEVPAHKEGKTFSIGSKKKQLEDIEGSTESSSGYQVDQDENTDNSASTESPKPKKPYCGSHSKTKKVSNKCQSPFKKKSHKSKNKTKKLDKYKKTKRVKTLHEVQQRITHDEYQMKHKYTHEEENFKSGRYRGQKKGSVDDSNQGKEENQSESEELEEVSTSIESSEDRCPTNSCGSKSRCAKKKDRMCPCRPENPSSECYQKKCSSDSDCSRSNLCSKGVCSSDCSDKCGLEAHCRVYYHKPQCECPPGYTGNPIVSCRQIGEDDLCKLKQCGANTVCKVKNDEAVCKCLPSYIGNPQQGCQHECEHDLDCSAKQACIDHKCEDACKLCGRYAVCESVAVHKPLCKCPEDYFGNPYAACRPECTDHEDCPKSKPACYQYKCTDPCIGACGIDANCKIQGVEPICSCPKELTGNPLVLCRPFERKDFCEPNPCGKNTKCDLGFDEKGEYKAVCKCKPGFYNLGKGDCFEGDCSDHDHCPSHKACVRFKCQDPCKGQCGKGSVCESANHAAVCSCPPGYTGNPTIECVKMTKKVCLICHDVDINPEVMDLE